jgi:hypothetical protein
VPIGSHVLLGGKRTGSLLAVASAAYRRFGGTSTGPQRRGIGRQVGHRDRERLSGQERRFGDALCGVETAVLGRVVTDADGERLMRRLPALWRRHRLAPTGRSRMLVTSQ